MQITIDVEKIDGLFLKQEMGTASIGDDELSFGICLPSGAPYVHVRGEYFTVVDFFQKMLRAVHEQTGCETPDEEHAAQPASTPERVAEIVASRDHAGADCAGRTPLAHVRTAACPAGADICHGRRCDHDATAEPDDGPDGS